MCFSFIVIFDFHLVLSLEISRNFLTPPQSLVSSPCLQHNDVTSLLRKFLPKLYLLLEILIQRIIKLMAVFIFNFHLIKNNKLYHVYLLLRFAITFKNSFLKWYVWILFGMLLNGMYVVSMFTIFLFLRFKNVFEKI